MGSSRRRLRNLHCFVPISFFFAPFKLVHEVSFDPLRADTVFVAARIFERRSNRTQRPTQASCCQMAVVVGAAITMNNHNVINV